MKKELRVERDSSKILNGRLVTLAKGGGITLISRILSMAMMLVAQAVLARSLGPTNYGLFSIGWSVLQIGGRLGPLGLHQGFIKFGSDYLEKDDERFHSLVKKTLLLAIIISGVVGGGIFIAAPIIASAFQKSELIPVLRFLAPAIASYTYLRISASINRTSKKVQFYTLAEDFTPAFLMLIGVFSFIVWLSLGLYGSLITTIIAFVGGGGISTYFVFHLFPSSFTYKGKESFPIMKLLSYSLPISITGSFAFLTQKVSRLIIGYFLSASEVGIYQAASQIAVMPTVILVSLNSIFSPLISTLFNKKQHQQLDELYKISTKWGIYLSIPLFLFIITFPSEILSITFGNEYSKGALVLIILALGQFFNTMSGGVGLLLNMTGNQTRWMTVTGGSFFLTTLFITIWTPWWGLLGAAIGNMLGISFMYLAGLWQAKKRLGFLPYDTRYWKGLIGSVLTSIALFILSKVNFNSNIIILTSGILVSFLVFGSFIMLAGFDEEDAMLIEVIINKCRSLIQQTDKSTVSSNRKGIK